MAEGYWDFKREAINIVLNDEHLTPVQRMNSIVQAYAGVPGRFDTNCMQGAQTLSVDEESKVVQFEILVTAEMCNRIGTMAGGAASTLLDILSSMTLTYFQPILYPNDKRTMQQGHVSRTLTLTYLRPVQEGQRIRIKCWPTVISKKNANLQGEIRTLDDELCVSCIHDKAYFAPPQTAKL